MTLDELDGEGRNQSARLFAALRAVNRELHAARDEREVFACACRHAVALAGFDFVWIGVVDRTRAEVVPVASAGEGESYLRAISVSIDGSPLGAGPTGTAAREARAVFCSDIAADPTMTPWREHALHRGFASSGAIPIRRDGEVHAVLNLYRKRVGFADALEKALAESLAEDVGFALDALVVESRRAALDEDLRSSEARYRSIVEHATDGMFVADASHTWLDVNPAGCRMLGYTREELVGRHYDDFLDPDELAARPSRPETWAPNVTFTTERRMVCKDGHRVDVEIHGVRTADGRLFSITRDVSERKRSAAEAAANERVLSLGRLAQGVGHEINNPLSYLMLNLEAARDRVMRAPPEVSGPVLEATDAALDGAKRIAHIVRSLSSFGRADVETITRVDPSRVVTAAVTLTRNRLAHVATLEVQGDPLPPVHANEFGLTQVLVNLLLNAADAIEEAPPGPHRVVVRQRVTEEGAFVIEVVDDGAGIPAHVLPRLFDPFFTTKPQGRGTGLGLSISRAMMTRFGGTLLAENVPGGGALFRIGLLPARPHTAEGAPPSTRRPQTGGVRRRVLVVDDEALVRRSVALLLARHEVRECADVATALEACRAAEPDCIVCDLMLPGQPGSALFEALTVENPPLARRILYVTGGAFTTSAQRFLEESGAPWLLKPFTHAELEAAIEQTAAR